MIFWDRLMSLWHKREAAPEALIARQLAQSISDRADALTEHLETYKRAENPFAALMADLYNRDQLDHLHRGDRQ